MEKAGRATPVVDARALSSAASLFRALGDHERLRLLSCLREGELCVSDLSEVLGDAMSSISQRLKVLRQEGLVARRREGKRVLYALADDHVVMLLDAGLAHAEQGQGAR